MTSLPPDVLMELDAIAAARHQTRADVLQEAADQFVRRQRPKPAARPARTTANK